MNCSNIPKNREVSSLVEPMRSKVMAWQKGEPEIWSYLRISETKRSTELQQCYFAQKDPVITTLDGVNNLSNHQLGKAIDVFFDKAWVLKEEGIDAIYPENIDRWRLVANSAKKYGIEWGFDLWGWDRPHFQDDGTPFDPESSEQDLLMLYKEQTSEAWDLMERFKNDISVIQSKLNQTNNTYRSIYGEELILKSKEMTESTKKAFGVLDFMPGQKTNIASALTLVFMFIQLNINPEIKLDQQTVSDVIEKLFEHGEIILSSLGIVYGLVMKALRLYINSK